MKVEVWPVVHVRDHETLKRNLWLASNERCDGAFLIAMDGDNDRLDELAKPFMFQRPIRLGVNYLGLPSVGAVLRSRRLGYDATWSDYRDVSSAGLHADGHAIKAHLAHPFFASVAFKTQPFEPNPAGAAHFADANGFVPTTSGPRTGEPPDVAKVRVMRGSTRRLAIASGVTPDNVESFLPHVTHILVNTGISHDFHAFDPERLARLMGKVAEHNALSSSPGSSKEAI